MVSLVEKTENDLQTDVQGEVLSLLEGLMGSRIAVDQPFMEAGLDSIGAVELRNNLELRFSLQLPASLLFDYPTVQSLSRFLAASLQPLSNPQNDEAGWVTASQEDRASSGAAAIIATACRFPGRGEGTALMTSRASIFLTGCK